MPFTNISDSDVTKFWEDGYLLIKNVFSPQEIEELRKLAYEAKAESQAKGLTARSIHANFDIVIGDLLSKKQLYKVVLDERIRNVAQKILGGPIIYFGDSTFQIGEGARGYHKDNANRKDPNSIDWQGKYPLLRFGIYCQDHKKFSGGLKVRKGSHNIISEHEGKSVLLPSEIGDLAVWNLRTSHSGNVVRLKGLPNLSIHTELEKRTPRWMRVDEQKERISFFLTYALKDPKTDAYFDFIRNHEFAMKSQKNSKVAPEVWEEAKRKNLEIVKIIPEYGQ